MDVYDQQFILETKDRNNEKVRAFQA